MSEDVKVEHTAADHEELGDPEYLRNFVHAMAHQFEALVARVEYLENLQTTPVD